MDETETQLHRTLVQFLIDSNESELAAVAIDGGMQILTDGNNTQYGVTVNIPSAAFSMVMGNEHLRQTLTWAATQVCIGNLYHDFGVQNTNDPDVQFRMQLLPITDGWQDQAKEMIARYKPTNQGTISRLLASRQNKGMILYNEASYASQSEIRIAQELEQRQVLFFPLALAIRADTGVNWRDHKEADFLVCHDGLWGILEVSYHPDRYEKDKEKDAWWKKSGILCVEHHTAERCYEEPRKVVDEFLSILAKHSKR